jgi:hypothetical protein
MYYARPPVFISQKISQGSFIDDDGLEMIPVVNTLRQPGTCEDADVDDVDAKPSNERLLLIAFVTFATFTMFQTGAAFVACSEAMMGNMFVDAITYYSTCWRNDVNQDLKKTTRNLNVFLAMTPQVGPS